MEKKRASRGVSRGHSLEKAVSQHGKLEIKFDPEKTTSKKNDVALSSAIGVVIRAEVDLGKHINGWDDVKAETKEYIMARIKHLFDIEDLETPRVRIIMEGKLKRSFWRWRCTLHGLYKDAVKKGIAPRSVSPRADLSIERWQSACDFIECDTFKKRSKTNKENCEKLEYTQTSGRTPFITRFEKMVRY